MKEFDIIVEEGFVVVSGGEPGPFFVSENDKGEVAVAGRASKAKVYATEGEALIAAAKVRKLPAGADKDWWVCKIRSQAHVAPARQA